MTAALDLAFVLTTADAAAGTERSVLNQANALAGRHRVTVYSIFRTADAPAFDVRPEVELRYLVDLRGEVDSPDPLTEPDRPAEPAADRRRGTRAPRNWCARSGSRSTARAATGPPDRSSAPPLTRCWW